MADALYQDGQMLSLKEFSRRLADDDREFRAVFMFLDGATRGEKDRFRFDRLVAAQLVLLATINRFGYDYQRVPYEQFLSVARECEHPVVRANLDTLTHELGLEKEEGFKYMVTAMKESTASR
ncbi:hypothetical protein [Streptomyces sp. NPDC098781]|uniref:hypothetical protein n=1 Tax=Streptomyces sp. NPDC098781 TaxID=3366097 RepID=UPI0038305ECE